MSVYDENQGEDESEDVVFVANILNSNCIYAPLITKLMVKVLGYSFCTSIKLPSYIYCNLPQLFCGTPSHKLHFS